MFCIFFTVFGSLVILSGCLIGFGNLVKIFDCSTVTGLTSTAFSFSTDFVKCISIFDSLRTFYYAFVKK